MGSAWPLQCRAADAVPKSSAACRRRSPSRPVASGSFRAVPTARELLGEIPPRHGWFRSCRCGASHGGETRLTQHRQQRMIAGPSVFARVRSLERLLLLAVTFQGCRIQVQAVARLARRQTLHLPFGHRLVEALDLAHTGGAKQIADRVVSRETIQARQRMQRAIAAQQTGVSEASGAYQRGYQERCIGGGRVDVIWRLPADRRVLSNRFCKTDLAEK